MLHRPTSVCTAPTRRTARRAVSLVEVLTAVAIVAVGIIPLFQVWQSARTSLGISRDMVVLQDEAQRLLAAGRARVRTGELRIADLQDDVVANEVQGEVRTTLTLSRFVEGRMLMLRARAESDDRFYETYQVVADPYSSFDAGAVEDDS